MKEGNIGLYETVCLTTLLITIKIFFTALRVLVKQTGTAAWYTTIISCLFSILCFLLIYLLIKRFPGKNLVEIFDAVTGKFTGKILSLIFFAYFIYYSGIIIREFLEMIKAYTLPYTPPSVVTAVLVTASLIFAYLGFEVIARIAYVGFFPIMLGVLTILFLSIPQYNPHAIFPVLGYGLDHTILYGVLRSSAYNEFILLAFFIPSIHGLKNFKKAGILSLTISGIIISVTALFYVMAFDYTAGSENLSGLFQLSRVIYYNRFFQRLESIFLFFWVAASVLAVAITFYAAVSIYCKTFKIRNHRPVLLPMSFLLFMISIIPKNLSETIEIHLLFIRQYSLFIVYLIPIAILILAVILGKKGGKENVEKV